MASKKLTEFDYVFYTLCLLLTTALVAITRREFALSVGIAMAAAVLVWLDIVIVRRFFMSARETLPGYLAIRGAWLFGIVVGALGVLCGYGLASIDFGGKGTSAMECIFAGLIAGCVFGCFGAIVGSALFGSAGLFYEACRSFLTEILSPWNLRLKKEHTP